MSVSDAIKTFTAWFYKFPLFKTESAWLIVVRKRALTEHPKQNFSFHSIPHFFIQLETDNELKGTVTTNFSKSPPSVIKAPTTQWPSNHHVNRNHPILLTSHRFMLPFVVVPRHRSSSVFCLYQISRMAVFVQVKHIFFFMGFGLLDTKQEFIVFVRNVQTFKLRDWCYIKGKFNM